MKNLREYKRFNPWAFGLTKFILLSTWQHSPVLFRGFCQRRRE